MLFTTEEQDSMFWQYVDEFNQRLEAITKKKGADYNKVASMPDYCPSGWKDSAVMLWKHSLRFLQFWVKDGERPQNEPVDETLLDIANYARYTYAMRRMAGVADWKGGAILAEVKTREERMQHVWDKTARVRDQRTGLADDEEWGDENSNEPLRVPKKKCRKPQDDEDEDEG